MNFLLDTNVICEFVAHRPNDKVLEWLDGLRPESVFLSVITIGEIRKGIEKLPPSKRKTSVKEWLETDLLIRFQDNILDATREVMLVWGEMVGRLEMQGKSIPAIDSLIAAIALQGNYHLVTRNTHDFRNTGVALIDPWEEVKVRKE